MSNSSFIFLFFGFFIAPNILTVFALKKENRKSEWSKWVRRIIVLIGVALAFMHPVAGIAFGGISTWSILDDTKK